MSLVWALMPVGAGTADHGLMGNSLRSSGGSKILGHDRGIYLRVSRASRLIRSVGGVLGGDSRSRVHHGWLTGSRDIERDEGARGWITCDPSGTYQSWCHVGLQGRRLGRTCRGKSRGDGWDRYTADEQTKKSRTLPPKVTKPMRA